MNTLTTHQLPNFEILELLGRGGMATVWKARQLSLDRLVAIKVLGAAFATAEADIRRFKEEACTAAQLKHPGIVQIYDANFSEGLYYFVMELVAGYTFGDLLRRKGRLPEEDALTIAESVAIALDYAWSDYRMIHCDIKPDNIMVDSDGSVKVTDLGLSRTLSRVATEHSNHFEDEIIGTPAYISPEQVYGQTALDCRADIYSLGATLYHLTTGSMLFQGQSDDQMLHSHVDASQAPDPREYAPELSAPFILLLEHMLAKDPRQRPSDWQQLLRALSAVRQAQPPTTLSPPSGSSLSRKTRTL